MIYPFFVLICPHIIPPHRHMLAQAVLVSVISLSWVWVGCIDENDEKSLGNASSMSKETGANVQLG